MPHLADAATHAEASDDAHVRARRGSTRATASGASVATRWWSREGEGSRASGIEAWLATLAVLALSMFSTVNIGMRHVLVVVPLLAIFVGQTVSSWLTRNSPPHRAMLGAALGLLLAFNVAIVERARPELMAYFNPLAGDDPARALIDSDLDWGQDFTILLHELRARDIAEAHVGFFGPFDPCHPGGPRLLPLLPGQRATGWVVLIVSCWSCGARRAVAGVTGLEPAACGFGDRCSAN